MPREQITRNRVLDRVAEHTTYGSTEPVLEATAQVEVQRRNLHVQWNRDAAWLQVAVDIPMHELRSLLADAEREAAAEASSQPPGLEYFTDGHPVRVWSDVLSRGETNAAITSLRRARDAAYGKDA
ncbi:hypothetical protein IFU40_13600 [Microbacterium sp. CFBP 13617]|uniref:hypothetical protein n=1 Tax=Microbacterium sp. CFBP 13617 TaxID=2774035 RepID=UPI00177D17A7|nr:hypothetical protein [Microbacterium sp. CFBP 13617]MBD8219668.1 hypothetical protein [Microbacterium sp. CFBP 13617]